MKRNNIKRINEEKGFTLIEILIVVVIIGALTAIIGPELFSRVSQANQTAAANQLDVFKVALNNYRLDNREYPSTDPGLEALVKNPYSSSSNWSGPYLEQKEIPLDPWGNKYQYMEPGEHNDHNYDLWSFGSDGQEGGKDEAADVTNW